MGLFDRVRSGFTVDRVSGAADLAVKFAAIVLAIGAIAIVFFGPKIQITTHRQTFIDEGVLREEYDGLAVGESTAVPPVVQEVVDEYNEANEEDLRLGQNNSFNRYPGTFVCEQAAELLVAVFPATNCADKEPYVGHHNHLWERLLILNISKQSDKSLEDQQREAETAVELMYRAQHLRVRTIVRNEGHARAINVNVRVPAGFAPNREDEPVSAFTLGPGEAPVVREYRSATGERASELTARGGGRATGAPVTRFGVDWERDQNAQAGVVLWVGLAFFVLWLAIVANDARLRRRAGSDTP